MGDQLVLVLVVVAALVLLATLVVWVRPLLRPVRPAPPATTEDPGAAPAAKRGADGFGRPLAHGFGYLFSPLGLPRRRSTLNDRLDRALQRVEQVDPYATHRRIGLALLATGSPDAPGQSGPEPATHPPTASTPWPPVGEPADPRETGR